MRAWALWSSRVDPYSAHELVELFAQQEVAEAVRAGLIGKPRYPGTRVLAWEDDEDFPDLYIRSVEIR
jgi:hypothetical protein